MLQEKHEMASGPCQHYAACYYITHETIPRETAKNPPPGGFPKSAVAVMSRLGTEHICSHTPQPSVHLLEWYLNNANYKHPGIALVLEHATMQFDAAL
jgi:hypothetical protein